jgi:hypothetical protein
MTYIDSSGAVIPYGEWDSVNYSCDGWAQVEYVRADLAGLPEELAERIRALPPVYDILTKEKELLRDILAWHEQQGGE